jgi:hypothetical protein
VQTTPYEDTREDVAGRGNTLPCRTADSDSQAYVRHKRQQYLAGAGEGHGLFPARPSGEVRRRRDCPDSGRDVLGEPRCRAVLAETAAIRVSAGVGRLRVGVR